jgi:hypothetical protein
MACLACLACIACGSFAAGIDAGRDGGDGDAGVDAGTPDAGAGLNDAGLPDAGLPDAGSRDDAGIVCDGGETYAAARAATFPSCNGFLQCHGSAPFGGDLDLTETNAYADLVNAPATGSPGKLRVWPGHPLKSFLVQKLTGQLTSTEGTPMPRLEGIAWHPPDRESLRVLECWIQSGAAR